MSELMVWLIKKLLTQKMYQRILILGLEEVALPLASKTDTQFDDKAIAGIIEALKS